MKKIICSTLIIAAALGSASGKEWSQNTVKGLQVFEFHEGTANLNLVCDPEGIWEPAEFHLLLTRSGQTLEGSSVSVTKGKSSLSLPLTGGAVLSTDQAAWNGLIDLLSDAGQGAITFSSDSASITINPDLPISDSGSCKRQ